MEIDKINFLGESKIYENDMNLKQVHWKCWLWEYNEYLKILY